MDEFLETDDTRAVLKKKLRQYFDGKIVRKDLTKHIKEGANVPVYVLEYLLGQYCSSDDEALIEEGVTNVNAFWQIILYALMRRRKCCLYCVSAAVIRLSIKLLYI